jgi:hypothetical protein
MHDNTDHQIRPGYSLIFDRFAWLINSVAGFEELDGIQNWAMIGIDVSARTMLNV